MKLTNIILYEEPDVCMPMMEFVEVWVDENGDEINEISPIRKRVRKKRKWKIRYFCPKGYRHKSPPGKPRQKGKCVKIPPAVLAKMKRNARRGAKIRGKKAARTRKRLYGK